MYRIGKEESDAVARVIASGELFKINNGAREVHNFEEELKAKNGSEYAICMTCGQAALISALVACGVGPGDEVIVPAYTYIATAIAVTSVGAIPVIVDVDESLTIDPAEIERNISSHTKAIIPVHIQGFPCDMDRINAIAKAHNLYVIEDACQADGGTYKGRWLGTLGDIGAYSFNMFKVITSGEGGALVTNSRRFFERALIYHDSAAIAYFGDQLDDITEEQFCGSEYRVGEITGAILREQLKRLDGILADLWRVKKAIISGVGDKYRLLPSCDYDGGVPSTVAYQFPDIDSAIAFEEKLLGRGFYCRRPINTGKHVYSNWTPIMNKKGAFNPKFDPFLMEENRGLNMNYSVDMCPKALDYLARTVYILVDPDADAESIDKLVAAIVAD